MRTDDDGAHPDRPSPDRFLPSPCSRKRTPGEDAVQSVGRSRCLERLVLESVLVTPFSLRSVDHGAARIVGRATDLGLCAVDDNGFMQNAGTLPTRAIVR